MSQLAATNDFVVVPTIPGRRYYFGLSSEVWGTASVTISANFPDSAMILDTKTANGFGEFVALTRTTKFALVSGTPEEYIAIVCGEIIQR